MAESKTLIKGPQIRTLKQCYSCWAIFFHSIHHHCNPSLTAKKKNEKKKNPRAKARHDWNVLYLEQLLKRPFELVSCLPGSKWYLAHITTQEWLSVLVKPPAKLPFPRIKQLLRLVLRDPRNWNVAFPKGQDAIQPFLMVWQGKWMKKNTDYALRWLVDSILSAYCLEVPAKPWCLDLSHISPFFDDIPFTRDLMSDWVVTSHLKGWETLLETKQMAGYPPAPLLLDQDKEVFFALPITLSTQCK